MFVRLSFSLLLLRKDNKNYQKLFCICHESLKLNCNEDLKIE